MGQLSLMNLCGKWSEQSDDRRPAAGETQVSERKVTWIEWTHYWAGVTAFNLSSLLIRLQWENRFAMWLSGFVFGLTIWYCWQAHPNRIAQDRPNGEG